MRKKIRLTNIISVATYANQGSVDGRYIPGNMSVAVNQVAMNRSPQNFANPDEFVPERWIGDGCFPDDQQGLCQPFSHGPRACLGRKYVAFPVLSMHKHTDPLTVLLGLKCVSSWATSFGISI